MSAKMINKLTADLKLAQLGFLEEMLGGSSRGRSVVVNESESPHKIVACSERWSELCGYSADEAIGQSHSSLLEGELTDTRAVRNFAALARAQGTANDLRTINYTKQGRPFVHRIWTSLVARTRVRYLFRVVLVLKRLIHFDSRSTSRAASSCVPNRSKTSSTTPRTTKSSPRLHLPGKSVSHDDSRPPLCRDDPGSSTSHLHKNFSSFISSARNLALIYTIRSKLRAYSDYRRKATVTSSFEKFKFGENFDSSKRARNTPPAPARS